MQSKLLMDYFDDVEDSRLPGPIFQISETRRAISGHLPPIATLFTPDFIASATAAGDNQDLGMSPTISALMQRPNSVCALDSPLIVRSPLQVK